MKYLALLLSLVSVGATPGAEDTWAVIAAGSAGFYNYRHQADACHAYQTLRKNGIPAEQIILMMQDDVASSSHNPFPGKLFNRNGTDVPDVYEGCKIDYRGSVVTAKLFIDVITGNDKGVPAGGKVLKSTSKDRVFLNFVDHGGVGIVAFPNGDVLHASDLSKALQSMKQKNMFSELLFYMEACESGSMFPHLPADEKIFAVTASNGKESSWGTYCMPYDKVNGKEMHACLGDLFSVAWMENADKYKSNSSTIKQQVAEVTKRTSKSHVSTFGDRSFEKEPFGNFESGSKEVVSPDAAEAEYPQHNAIDVRDIPMQTAYYRLLRAKTDAEKKAALLDYEQIVKARKDDDSMFQKVVEGACSNSLSLPTFKECVAKMQESTPVLESDSAMQCHKVLASAVFGSCPRRSQNSPGGWNAYSMKYSKHLANICINLQALQKDAASLEAMIHTQCAVGTSGIIV